MSKRLCIVLFNQHRNLVDECLEIHRKYPSRPVLFQPEREGHLRQIHKLENVPIYMVVGEYGETAEYRGKFESHEYNCPRSCGETSHILSESRKKELAKFAFLEDSPKVWAQNIIIVTQLSKLTISLPLERFIKVSNDKPLEPGTRFPAIVCYEP